MNTLQRTFQILKWLALLFFVPLLLLVIFGFSIKSTAEYDCVIETVQRNRQVVAVTGEPVEAGFFAWISFFESSGGLRQGAFSTALTGPTGKGKVRAEFYRSPVGSSLYIRFNANGQETVIYTGEYACP